MTQGRGDGHEWVTAFMISYSMNAFNWYYVKDQYGNQKVRIATFLNHDMTKTIKWVCGKWRLWSAWASAQADQSLRFHASSVGN